MRKKVFSLAGLGIVGVLALSSLVFAGPIAAFRSLIFLKTRSTLSKIVPLPFTPTNADARRHPAPGNNQWLLHRTCP